MIKFKVKETGDASRPYYVEKWLDNGNGFYTTGGEYCRTLEEVERYKRAAIDGYNRREKEIRGE